jgi:hypothetical protein
MIALGFWAYVAIRDIKNIILLLRGRKYYKFTFGKVKKEKQGNYVDDFQFN